MQVTNTQTSNMPSTATAEPKNKSAISSDFETFLKMLTVQMENQDPLNPVDSSDYAVQLATFSGVEQQVLTNDLLEGLAMQLGTAGMAQMASWVGNDARSLSPAAFDGAPITVSPNPAAVADRAELVVRTLDGTEVQRLNIPVSSDPMEWFGTTDNGATIPGGDYEFFVASYANGTLLTEEQAEVYARIREVRTEAGETQVLFKGGISVPATSVTALREGD